jgi:DNA-binding transcriptional LysR family regulator
MYRAKTEDELGVTLFERRHFGIRLTNAGRAILVQVRRVLADLEAVWVAGRCNGSGEVGHIRLGVRMPPIGMPLQSLLEAWRIAHPKVALTIHEMNERDILVAVEERRLDVAFMTKHTLWPHAVAEPIYREPILAALPKEHRLAKMKKLAWDQLREETFLVQGWDESQTAREFYASFMGSGVRYQTHAASKQTIMALVGARFGVTLVSQSQAEVRFPNVAFKAIAEDNARLETELVWVPQMRRRLSAASWPLCETKHVRGGLLEPQRKIRGQPRCTRRLVPNRGTTSNPDVIAFSKSELAARL